MSRFRIVHLSDLHFHKDADKSIWDMVVEYVNDKLKPDAIFITGDVTNNAIDDEFEIAKASLSLLKANGIEPGKPNYYIVPGNHDRYDFLGNNVRFLPSKEKPKYRYKELLFEQYFKGHSPTPEVAADIVLKNTDCKWHIRVIGIDSNNSSWFAQGLVEEKDAKSVKKTALNDTRSDLVIALVHHHLLPIPEVERNASFGNVINFTGMINAGILLNNLSDAQVNIVLHGHEHTTHLARFCGSGLFSGTTAILSAGSGTGESTGHGWALNRVHFNVLELESSRSVYWREVSVKDGELSLGDRRLLLTDVDIRKAQFVRRNRNQDNKDTEQNRSLPTSRIKKLFRLEADRSATVTESRTEFASKSEWSLTTRNSSGHLDGPADIEVFIERDAKTYKSPFVHSEEYDRDDFTCGLPLDMNGQALLLKRTTASWRWAGAALLCKSDAKLLPSDALGGLRRNHREFVGLRIGADEEYEQCSITLSMPPDYSPLTTEFCVHYENLKSPNDLHISNELTSALEFCGRGHIELRIPFPSPATCYYISWPLYSDQLEYKKIRRITQIIETRVDEFRTKALQLINDIDRESIRVSLYTHSNLQNLQLTRMSNDTEVPLNLDLQDRRSRARTSLFGELQIIAPDSDDACKYLLPDEAILVFVSIDVIGDTGICIQHPALLRVAAKHNSGLTYSAEEQISKEVLDFVFDACSAADAIAKLAQTN